MTSQCGSNSAFIDPERRAQAIKYLTDLFEDHFIILIIGQNAELEENGETFTGLLSSTVTNIQQAEGTQLMLTAAMESMANGAKAFDFQEVKRKMI